MNSVLMDNLFCVKPVLHFAIGHITPSLYTHLNQNLEKYKQCPYHLTSEQELDGLVP